MFWAFPLPLAFAVELVWWYSILSFCLCIKLSVSLSNLNKSILGCKCLPFITLNISCLLACSVSAEKSADSLRGFPCMLFVALPLVAFNISFCLFFLVSLSTVCLSVFLLGLILYGTLCAGWLFPFLCFSYYHFKYFLRPFLSLFSFCDTPIMQTLVHLTFPRGFFHSLSHLFCYWLLLVYFSITVHLFAL